MNNEIAFNNELQLSNAYLHFEDGTVFKGKINRKQDDKILAEGIWGEAAFTTAMSGYQETATDPSFLGQHIIFSTAHVGTYKANDKVNQSKKTHATCLIARNFSHNEFLENIEVPLFSDLDVRSLVQHLTSTKNSHKSVLTTRKDAPSKAEFDNAKLVCCDLEKVSVDEKITLRDGKNPIVVIDYGIKQAILDNLLKLDKPVVQLPYNASIEVIKSLDPSLIFLSNGPGDPKTYTNEINVVKEILTLNIPVRGICLGHQLLTHALGGETIRLPFGQRGVNHPVLDHVTNEILITSQNHGYATDSKSFEKIKNNNPLDKELFIQYSSLFDKSIEGMSTTDHFLKSVQFHPEANPGPSDATVFFLEIGEYLSGDKKENINSSELHSLIDLSKKVEKDIPYKRILLIGSGPIKIGQASEFDYSGTQACKSLKELGVEVILLNSNPATIMTDPEMAYKTYIEPITHDTIKKIIEKDDVDAVLSTMGGQTALNVCVDLENEGYLKSKNVALLGANVDTINRTEDRDLFAAELTKLGYQTGKRYQAYTEEEAIKMAKDVVGYPLITRRDFALGGKGAALLYKESDFDQVFTSDLKFPITMEKSLVGWKEFELEVMVDKERNGVIICSIENVDPCGIHTGDSITVAPALTISDTCYQKLRTMSLTIAKHMGVVAGGANVQFAINPQDENDIIVIEMNPRVSRSSALASKATGYPIAKISALLAVGYTLREILNDITKASPVCFEPTLDYIALKIPIFPFNKFPSSSRVLGPQMRSVGEVLALGGNFNEAFLKALRSLEMGLEIPTLTRLKTSPFTLEKEYLKDRLSNPYELSILTVLDALRAGISEEEISRLSNITPWFIDQMSLIVHKEEQIKTQKEESFNAQELLACKKIGMSDKHLAMLWNKSQEDILNMRMKEKIFPVYKAVDTCSGEFDAKTPYFYSTYTEKSEAESLSKNDKSIIILGSGPNRIGQGIEFDYSCVKSCQHLVEKNIKSIMVNSNPETVSTDYDSSDRLYLSPLYSEDLFDILLNENPYGVITSFSGQTGINIREHIETSFRAKHAEFNFLGASLDTLDLTEDRKRFAEITKSVDLSHTKSKEVQGFKSLMNAMIEIGLPVIIRPSYVIGGESMYIFHHHDDINELPDALKTQLKESSTVFQVETYLEDALEYDVDLIRDNSGNTVFTICEHIEHAGVHSGDSGMISPPVVLNKKTQDKMRNISIALAEKLNIIGPINFQFAVKNNDIYCIEANPRGSRTLPFLSKASNISLPNIATDAMLGESISTWELTNAKHFCVKQSTFPFDRFVQDNIILGPKMRSTGETLGIDADKDKAVLKSYLGNYPNLSDEGKILISLTDKTKMALLPYMKLLGKAGYEFIGTPGTAQYIEQQGLKCDSVSKIESENSSTILDCLKDQNIRMVFNTPMSQGRSKSDGEYIRNTAIQYGIPCFTRIENIKAVMECLIGSHNQVITPINLQEMHSER
jgi:carbamoyl-phosphate synthase large subunit